MSDVEQLFLEGVRLLHAGDRDGARAVFGKAGAAGQHHSAVIHCNLTAQADWPRGLALLRGLAERSARCRAELALIEAMDLAPNGDPATTPAGRTMEGAPGFTWYDGLLTAIECDYLVRAARPMLQPSVVVDQRTGRQVPDPVRTSDGTGFTWPLENPAVHALNRRIAAATGAAVERGEPLQVLRYRPGQQYRAHFDAIPGWKNQRVLTVLAWLNADYEGGATCFPRLGLTLKGKPGDALAFRNVGVDGRRDEATTHAGMPVTAGEKYLASRWIRARPVISQAVADPA